MEILFENSKFFSHKTRARSPRLSDANAAIISKLKIVNKKYS